MIDFSKIGTGTTVDTVLPPREIFNALPHKDDEKFQYPRDVQSQVWTKWFARREEESLVIKMNTGSGKTVVGLLILKSCLNEGKFPAVYICPDKYLVQQVLDASKELGVEVTDDVNSPRFLSGKAILVANIYKLIAPEEPGAMNFIDKVKDNVVVSIAHTAADYDTAMEAIQHGATHATHLYNAMPPMNHRKPGVIGAIRDSYQCHAELICDGVHIHPSVIRATFAMLGAGRIILISDSMRATGLEDGEYTLGGQPVVVKGNLATLHDGTIAGSATNLMDCLRYVVKKAGISLETAVMCATENPAKEIGIYDKVGSISVGKQADFVLIDEELNIKRVYIDGKEIIC